LWCVGHLQACAGPQLPPLVSCGQCVYLLQIMWWLHEEAEQWKVPQGTSTWSIYRALPLV
jgi:hypothetical protein